MQIGAQLKEARQRKGMTQEEVAGAVGVSRQTVSNWENERSYPDIVSVVRLSDLYSVSLDTLLKGDEQMLNYLKESTDTVRSSRSLLWAVGANAALFLLFLLFNGLIQKSPYLILLCAVLGIAGACGLFYQIIRRI